MHVSFPVVLRMYAYADPLPQWFQVFTVGNEFVYPIDFCRSVTHHIKSEAVLFTLVSTFKFAPVKDKEISWSTSGITVPFVNGDTTHPRMPLIVSLADQSKDS